eukprot:3329599-Rhodomonas_salina.1
MVNGLRGRRVLRGCSPVYWADNGPRHVRVSNRHVSLNGLNGLRSQARAPTKSGQTPICTCSLTVLRHVLQRPSTAGNGGSEEPEAAHGLVILHRVRGHGGGLRPALPR